MCDRNVRRRAHSAVMAADQDDVSARFCNAGCKCAPTPTIDAGFAMRTEAALTVHGVHAILGALRQRRCAIRLDAAKDGKAS